MTYVVDDALSLRSNLSQLVVERMSIELCKEFHKLNLRIVTNTEVVAIEMDSTLPHEIQQGQLEDKKI
jgi:hypothetical protein